MPTFRALDQERIAELTRRNGAGGVVDLTDQKNWISRALTEGSGWGEVALDPSDNIRAIKRRTTIAGKEQNKVIKWHRKSTSELLVFRVMDPDSIVKRIRRAVVRVESQLTDVIEKAVERKPRSRKKPEAS